MDESNTNGKLKMDFFALTGKYCELNTDGLNLGKWDVFCGMKTTNVIARGIYKLMGAQNDGGKITVLLEMYICSKALNGMVFTIEMESNGNTNILLNNLIPVEISQFAEDEFKSYRRIDGHIKVTELDQMPDATEYDNEYREQITGFVENILSRPVDESVERADEFSQKYAAEMELATSRLRMEFLKEKHDLEAKDRNGQTYNDLANDFELFKSMIAPTIDAERKKKEESGSTES